MGYIYLITNIDDGKKYVGQTREENVETRWKAHTKESSNCIYLKRALKKYGIEKFKFEIIILCFDEDMNDYEMEYIEKFNTVIPNGYNITKGGSGWKGKHSEATKEKLRKINKEYYSNIENRLRLGIKVKEGMKNINISERMLKSEKWINALKEGRVGGNKKSTPVIQLDDDKNEIAKYSSINEAARQLSTNVSRISIALKNNTRTAGYYWIIDTSPIENKKKNKVKKNNTKVKNDGCGIQIGKYTLDGILLDTYSSINEAGRNTIGCSTSTIRRAVLSDNNETYNFLWKKIDNRTSEEKKQDIKNTMTAVYGKKISQYDLNGNKIASFDSIRDAERITKISRSTIRYNLDKTIGREFLWKTE